MKNLYSISSKSKVAITLLSMIILLLCGVLVERYFFSKMNEGSASMYNDRLIPSTAIFHLSDHIAQRRLLMLSKARYEDQQVEEIQKTLSWHQHKEDSIITAFEQTYLVEDESVSLEQLKAELNAYNQLEANLITSPTDSELAKLDIQYSNIREELMELSNIQTRVGQKLQTENERLTSNADVITQLLVVVLIITCLIAQAFVLASKSIIPAISQKHNLN
tara:strand:+ start:410 stop:1069 length:660 start_codon:yes stop_codon:yes gene_type:complete